MSKSPRPRAPRRARTPIITKTGKRWISVYLAAVVVGAIGIAVSGVATSSGKVARLEHIQQKHASPESRIASLKPSLQRDGAIASHSFIAASAAILPARSKFGASWFERFETPKTLAASEPVSDDPFDRVVKNAALSREDMALAFKQAAVASIAKHDRTKAGGVKVARIDPSNAKAARLASLVPAAESAPGMLAFADPSPKTESGAIAAVSAMAGNHGETVVASLDPAAALPALEPEASEYTVLPDDMALPSARPKYTAKKPEPEEAAPAKPEAVAVARPDVDETTRTLFGRNKKKDDSEGTKVAFAKPDDVTKKEGFSFGRSPKAGNGVAVYDISAARVYMPDGTVLEAHSGIGRMADNPKYVHVKMRGPTPPHTYNLRMREKRFHGVEAIRMLPVDGRNKHGRDGFLTHSYLLRGGRAESHGCVAFKDYDKFLRAFKAGKVKQLVVVPGGGKSMAASKNKSRNNSGSGEVRLGDA
ncbi:MAG TPA: tlde1 domain-containing protein [Rhizobiaceae bacterium]|nr:tlde1 domain-containing protein [Rhizobiaceae bacterium]